jgi:hypothetical protein
MSGWRRVRESPSTSTSAGMEHNSDPKTLAVVIPRDPERGPLRGVRRGSGMVGHKSGDLIEVYFEGNLYGAVNLTRFEDRVLCAADRLVARYPTTAKRLVALTDLEVIGTCYPDRGEVVIGRPDLLAVWLDEV